MLLQPNTERLSHLELIGLVIPSPNFSLKGREILSAFERLIPGTDQRVFIIDLVRCIMAHNVAGPEYIKKTQIIVNDRYPEALRQGRY